ncbi:RNA polymerase factor sigma-54 [Aquabacterium fontiphilum]|jgi:RNA polymerase sigma-54 factor|uniref:RNA polymerase factor sigma-54 n=1 Tax=Aquabacterium fontiphilum TaxID=450365 RepID=UPI0013788467|nr:RNA polymerase factor sigma-54 [Aquabacterium fontiphilum]NBD21603.1 RNA polymerase factor sigma-54 [Aquabacterium fontiphilum]
MKPSLQFRLSQHLALTPQLQQSIRLLQLSTLELHQEVEQMLEQNPFLEPDDEYASLETAAATEYERQRQDHIEREDRASGEGEGAADAEPAGLDGLEVGATERDDWENGTERDDFDGIRETPSRQNDDDEFDPLSRNTESISLQEHLRQQLRGMRLPPQDKAAVEVLIESLNEDGYLADTLDDIAASLLGVTDDEDARDELASRLRCALGWLQSLEPNGVGASSLSECLLLQLRGMDDHPACALARTICRDHLELLARRDTRKLTAATGADDAQLKAAQALIVSLEPKPGRAFARAEANIVVPDVIVQKSGRNWKVVLNPDVMPKLRINDLYAQALRASRGGRGSGDGHAALSSRLQEARWFVKNIQQRFDTILRVSQAIVDRQKNFFTHGEIAMKPLVLREIADELGLHESTISRVTTAKYMNTPFGTFELKYFFGSSLNTEAGGNASSTAVRALIKQLVASEDPRKPLSDSALSSMLEEQGIQVARRTVAKYREALKIAPANLRKAL